MFEGYHGIPGREDANRANWLAQMGGRVKSNIVRTAVAFATAGPNSNDEGRPHRTAGLN